MIAAGVNADGHRPAPALFEGCGALGGDGADDLAFPLEVGQGQAVDLVFQAGQHAGPGIGVDAAEPDAVGTPACRQVPVGGPVPLMVEP